MLGYFPCNVTGCNVTGNNCCPLDFDFGGDGRDWTVQQPLLKRTKGNDAQTKDKEAGGSSIVYGVGFGFQHSQLATMNGVPSSEMIKAD